MIVASLRAAGCVFAEDEARLLISEARDPNHLATMVGRRTAGLPLEHIVGWAEFCGQRVAVDPGVFVPRRRTEFLARQAITLARSAITALPSSRTVVVDLCCGSGAVAAALTAGLGRIELHAVDVDPAAVRCARRNLAASGGQVHQGNLYQPLPATLRGRVDVLVVNAPYVPTEAVELLPPEARLYEPRVALDGGPDGLDVLNRVIDAAPAWLASDGHLLIEASQPQAAHLVQRIACAGLTPRTTHCDEPHATVVIGSRIVT